MIRLTRVQWGPGGGRRPGSLRAAAGPGRSWRAIVFNHLLPFDLFEGKDLLIKE